MADQDEDQSVLDAAFSSNRDRGADTAAPEPQDKPKPEAETAKADAKPDADGESRDPFKEYRDPDTKRLVPLTELKSEREKRQEFARLRDEAERRAAIAEEQLAEARRAWQFQQQPHQTLQHQQQPQIPDPFTDPEAYQQYVVEQAQHVALSERLNTSQMLAEEKHGTGKVQAALQAANQMGVLRGFIQTRNPYGELVKWYDRQMALSEIGDDVPAYKANLEKQIREKVLQELKSGQASPQQRFPGTLADASASGAQGAMMLSDQAMLDSIFASDRKRR